GWLRVASWPLQSHRKERLELVVHAARERRGVLMRGALVDAAREQHDDAARAVEEADAADVGLGRDERPARDLVRLFDAGQLREQLVVALLRLARIEAPHADRDVER